LFCTLLWQKFKPKIKKYMKFRINLKVFALIAIAFTTSLILNSCKEDESGKTCEGYTGKLTDPRADSLVNRCHFLSKDSIEVWVARYDAYKKQLERKSDYTNQTGNTKDTVTAQGDQANPGLDAMAAGFLKRGSISYNSCIIKKILCDKNSIGLRVLYGIGGDNRIHIILVGIQPDYSNLYVDGEDCCSKSLNKSLANGISGINGAPGGAEYGQMP
jgi:hypothetical protein